MNQEIDGHFFGVLGPVWFAEVIEIWISFTENVFGWLDMAV